nr:PREDICTED: AT-hook-containing transcription factor-like [Latimeria chalumnae]|eukprot:XP_006006908.2 PREDICTED: AT-hook-containing transcription factor-like [Latimeria chalumnae]
MKAEQDFESLKAAQDALERGYLQTREGHRRQQQQGGINSLGKFDQDRAVEGQIFCLGMRLEDLKERIDQSMQSQPSSNAPPEPELSQSLAVAPISELLTQLPTPSALSPVPMVRTPYPKDPVLEETEEQPSEHVDPISRAEDWEALPETLQHKQLQVEGDFHKLLDQYQSLKTLPDIMAVDLVQEVADSPQGEATTKDAGIASIRLNGMKRKLSLKEEPSWNVPELHAMEPESALLQSKQDPSQNCNPQPSAAELLLPHTSTQRRGPGSPDPKMSYFGRKEGLSRQSSEISLAESGASDHLPRKPLHRTKSLPLEERIVSPETDSGFVGSESSRFTPALRTPEHQRPLVRHPSLGERLVWRATRPQTPFNGVTQVQDRLEDGILSAHKASQATGLRRPKIPQGSPSRASSPQQWTGSVTSEFDQDVYATHMDSEVEEQSGISAYEQLPGSHRHRQSSFSSTPSPQHLQAQPGSDPLKSHTARDKAIQALQKEVSRLRRRLEESLCSPTAPLEEIRSSTMTRPRRQTVENPLSLGSSAVLEKSSKGKEEVLEEPSAHVKNSTDHVRSTSLPRHRPELEISEFLILSVAPGSELFLCLAAFPGSEYTKKLPLPGSSFIFIVHIT